VFAGLRIGELVKLRWRHVDLTGDRITVRESKTGAGVRQIDMLPIIRDELLALKAAARRTEPAALVFATVEGLVKTRATSVTECSPQVWSRRLTDAGEVPLPERLTPHKLRHTFASPLVALGVDPGSVMDQLGHIDPAFTLRVYRHGMRWDEQSTRALRELVGLNGQPPDWAAATCLLRLRLRP
jgi:integrase